MAAVRDGVERFGDRMAALALVRPKRPEPLPILIGRGRIYILPTGFGLFIALMLTTMLIGGLNYNNNPALLLVFLLAAAANNSLLRAHLTLSGVRLKTLRSEPVFAGQSLAVTFRFDAEGMRARPGLELLAGLIHGEFDLDAGADIETTLALPTRERGWFELGRLRLSTLQPLGLARAWSWLKPDIRLLVYPALDAHAPPLPEAQGEGSSPRTRSQGEQPHHLRDYRSGDTPRQIAWKASARNDRLLVREYEATAARKIVLDWHSLPRLDHEAKIRRLACWVVDAEHGSGNYSLRLPGQTIGFGRGAEHRHACLRALALLPHA